MNNKEVPKGLRDILPPELKKRRYLHSVAERFFSTFGYEEVETPMFELLDVVENGTGREMREQMFIFMDRFGGLLALRPEMTVSIARLAATHFAAARAPKRLWYRGNVFRQVEPQLAKFREFEQMGIELIGASGTWADAEVIALAARILQELRVEDFRISLNHIGIFNNLVKAQNLRAAEHNRLKQLVEAKDLVELQRLLFQLPLAEPVRYTLSKLPVLHGGAEILEKIPYLHELEATKQAVEELLAVYECLAAYGVQEYVVLDMGVIRGLNYYTGVIFEGYSPRLGYSLMGGGRYDKLMGQFGEERPATGFALGVDRLGLVVNAPPEPPAGYWLAGDDLALLLYKADELRQSGKVVRIDMAARPLAEAQAFFREQGSADQFIYVSSDDQGGSDENR